MQSNELYYLVGLAGSGKTTVCKQLAESVDQGSAIQASGAFKNFLMSKGVDGFSFLNKLTDNDRQMLVDAFHLSLEKIKSEVPYTFLDAHMLVENSTTKALVCAMTSKNEGVAAGVIYLNTPCDQIYEYVQHDNDSIKRLRNTKSIEELKCLAENEFIAAESFCLSNNIKFGILNNLNCSEGRFQDVMFLNKYILTADSDIRADYLEQFNPDILPSKLRKIHYQIGDSLRIHFLKKTGVLLSECQVIAVPRSGNKLADGFVSEFDGSIMVEPSKDRIDEYLEKDKGLVIIDSVIDSGATIKNILDSLPDDYTQTIHVICLAINIKALGLLSSVKEQVSFHCIGFSNKEDRPKGKEDMGARLYGTEN